MTLPTFKVEIAFANNPLDASPTWTDVTTYVKRFNTQRGRNHELRQIDPGSASVTLYNNDGAFSPWNSASPYYNSGTGLLPMKQIRISGTFSATTYQMYRGFIQSFPINWQDSSQTEVTIQCLDALSLLDSVNITGPGYSDAVLADVPTAYWRMDEDTGATSTYDSSGNGNNATPVNVTLASDSLIAADSGKSYDFGHASAGTGGYVRPPSSLVISDPTQSFSFECWVKIPSLPILNVDFVYLANQYVPPHIVTTGTQNDWYVFVDPSGNVNFLVGNNNTNVLTHPTNIADGKVHHVVCVYTYIDATHYSLKITVDGSKQTGPYGPTVPTFAAASSTFFVGGIYPNNARMWGQMDEVALYKNVALSDARITVHYGLGSTPWHGDTTGVRVGEILDLAGWPASLRSLDTGNSLLQDPTSGMDTTAAQYLQTLMDTENGIVYVDPSGNVVFHERHKVLTGSYLTSQLTLGENEEPYLLDGTQATFDLVDTFNDAQISRQGGVIQESQDASSQASYGTRTYSKTSLLMTTDAEASDYAHWITSHYAQPVERVATVMLDPNADSTNLSPKCLGLDLQSRVTFKRRQMGGVDVFTQDSLIEGIEHTVDMAGNQWRCAWHLSPADTVSYWALNSSALGTGTRLAY